jgi:hypothetical protein
VLHLMVNPGGGCSVNCCAGNGAKSKKKKGGSLTLTPESEAYLCNVCVCLKFLTAAGNADCYRVAAAGCLPALVQLAAGSKHTRLRQSAKVGTYYVCYGNICSVEPVLLLKVATCWIFIAVCSACCSRFTTLC